MNDRCVNQLSCVAFTTEQPCAAGSSRSYRNPGSRQQNTNQIFNRSHNTKLVPKNANTPYLCRCHGHRRPPQNVPIPFESARAYIISFSQNKVFQKRCVSSFGFMRSHDVPAVVTVEGWRAQRVTFVYTCFLCSPCGIPAMPSSCLTSII